MGAENDFFLIRGAEADDAKAGHAG